MLDSNAPSYIVCLNKNNINHDDTNTKKLSINNNSLTININLISIIKKNIDTYTS